MLAITSTENGLDCKVYPVIVTFATGVGNHLHVCTESPGDAQEERFILPRRATIHRVAVTMEDHWHEQHYEVRLDGAVVAKVHDGVDWDNRANYRVSLELVGNLPAECTYWKEQM